MSERFLRKSTQELRKCYGKPVTPKRLKPQRTHSPRNNPRRDSTARNMPTPIVLPVGQAGANPPVHPAPGDAPQPGDANDAGHADPGAQLQESPKSTGESPRAQEITPAQEHESRISRLEQELKEYKEAKQNEAKNSKRSASRSTARSRSSRRSTRRRSRTRSRSRHRHSSRRTKTRSRSRSSRHSSRASKRRRSRSRSKSSRSTKRRTTSRSTSRRRERHRSRRSSTRSRSPSRRARRRRSPSHHHRSRSRSKQRRSPRRAVETAIEAQYPSMGKAKGEPLPIKGLSLEPYYCLPPDLRVKARSRRSRRDLTLPEYMCGLLNLIVKSTPKDLDTYAVLEHAAQVAQDAAGYTWPAVREWSQTCMAHIEDDKRKWANYEDFFAKERTRLSWMKGKPAQEIKVPCHDHNADKCNERATHYSEGKTWVHGCGVCVYASTDEAMATSACTHTVRNCRRKSSLKYTHDDARGDPRRRTNYSNPRKDYHKADAAQSKN